MKQKAIILPSFERFELEQFGKLSENIRDSFFIFPLLSLLYA